MARADETPAPVNQKMSPSSNNRFGTGTTPMRVPSPNGTRREEAPPRGKRLVVPEVRSARPAPGFHGSAPSPIAGEAAAIGNEHRSLDEGRSG